MARKPKPQQPGALTPQPAGGELYKASLHGERQKLGRSREEVHQLVLSEPPPEPAELLNSGLDFTVSEDRAYTALQKLLDRTGYQGNLEPVEVRSSGYQRDYRLPTQEFTPSEYFEAYGLKQHKGRYQGKQREEALEALKSLARKPRTILYKRTRWQGKGQSRKKVYDYIRHTAPILELMEDIRGVEEEEAARLEAGEDLPGRVTRLAVRPGPLFVDDIEGYFLLKPASLHREIEDHFDSKRYSPSVLRFISWLLMWNRTPVQIHRENLAERLRLKNLLEQRKPSQLKRQLQECIDVAQALDFLLEYKEDAFGVFTFKLNPKRNKRLGQKEEEEAEPPISG